MPPCRMLWATGRYRTPFGSGGEDFAFFGEKVPISYFWLGVDSPHIKSAPIHNAGFNPDEQALSYGCQTLCNAALRFLNE